MAGKWQANGRQMAGKWQANGRQMAGKWQRGRQRFFCPLTGLVTQTKLFVVMYDYGKQVSLQMENKSKAVVLFLAAGVLLSGCATQKARPSASPPPVDNLLAKSASLIHNDLMQLNNLRQANSVYAPDFHKVPKGPLGQKMSLAWSGPAHEPVKLIAETLGWEYRTVGKQPADPLFVFVRAVNQPVLRVLEDIGSQMGTKAGIDLNASERVIVVDYRPATTADGGRTWHQ